MTEQITLNLANIVEWIMRHKELKCRCGNHYNKISWRLLHYPDKNGYVLENFPDDPQQVFVRCCMCGADTSIVDLERQLEAGK